MGGACAYAVGDCCRVWGLVAALPQGGVMWESVWGTLRTLRCAVCGLVAWGLFEGGSFPM